MPETEVASEPEGKVAPPKPTFIIYPVLFSIFPVLAIYSANLAVIPFVMIVRPVAAIVAAVLALWLVLGLLTRSASRGAIGSTVLVAMVFLFKNLQKLTWTVFIPPEYDLGIWSVTTALLVVLMAWKFNKHKLANFLSVALVVTSSAQIVFGLAKSASLRATEQATLGHAGQPTSRPDIFYVILDGYGRSDALQRALGFDNHKFVDGLESRGFYVAKDSRANYCQTELSVGSSLNLDYVQSLLTKVDKKDNDRRPLGDLIDHNAAAKYLREKGYIFAAVTTGFPPLQFDSADVNMRSRAGMSMIETALIQLTPLVKNTGATESMRLQRREAITNAFEAIGRLKVKNIKPRFIVVHILAPHPPFIFGPDGQVVNQKGTFGFWDGSDYIEHVGNADNYRNGYTGQATYIGNQMLASLDNLLNSDGEKPVILIQGDHGSKLRLDQDSLAKTDINECFPNLSAYYVPDSVRKNLYPSITPVNSFRVLFNGLFNDDLPLKEDKSWYSTFPLPYDFTEVTNKIADHTNMPSVPLPK